MQQQKKKPSFSHLYCGVNKHKGVMKMKNEGRIHVKLEVLQSGMEITAILNNSY